MQTALQGADRRARTAANLRQAAGMQVVADNRLAIERSELQQGGVESLLRLGEFQALDRARPLIGDASEEFAADVLDRRSRLESV